MKTFTRTGRVKNLGVIIRIRNGQPTFQNPKGKTEVTKLVKAIRPQLRNRTTTRHKCEADEFYAYNMAKSSKFVDEHGLTLEDYLERENAVL
tara:strand:+ start:3136 stop:3411 length:276 start_codon:yes stop_codon:yes gene_type:complete